MFFNRFEPRCIVKCCGFHFRRVKFEVRLEHATSYTSYIYIHSNVLSYSTFIPVPARTGIFRSRSLYFWAENVGIQAEGFIWRGIDDRNRWSKKRHLLRLYNNNHWVKDKMLERWNTVREDLASVSRLVSPPQKHRLVKRRCGLRFSKGFEVKLTSQKWWIRVMELEKYI